MSRSSLAVGLGLLVALAVGLGLGAILFSSNTKTSTTTQVTAADTHPISLPPNLAGFRDLVDVFSSNGASPTHLQQQRRNQVKVRSATETAYRLAFGGAAAAYRAYADSGLTKLPYVIAVRADAPGLTVGPVLDASYLRLATPPRQVKTVGPVSCQIDWNPPTLAGQRPGQSSEQVVGCQRSGARVTVFVGGGGFIGPADLQAMANLANAAWSAISGG